MTSFHRPRNAKPLVRFGLAVVVLALLAYLAAALIVYERASRISGSCTDPTRVGTPDQFRVVGVDTTSYLMPLYATVSFPSRDSAVAIRATYVPGRTRESPVVIVVHGLGTCRNEVSVLLPAGMLHRHGFGALLVDLRDHGESQPEDDRFAGGTEEYRDVLGAWDWLRAQGTPSERIGLLGVSMGAASVLIAAGEEPGVAAVWEDSGYADVLTATEEELARQGYPTFLAPAGLIAGRAVSGDDLTSLSPLRSVARLAPRPLAITHGTADERLSVHFATDLAAAYRSAGGEVRPWLIQGAKHVQGMVLEADEYERRLASFFRVALAFAGR